MSSVRMPENDLFSCFDLECRDPLSFDVARTPAQVLAAWRLVHRVYAEAGLIDPSPEGIHTYPQSITSHATVFQLVRRRTVESTLTGVIDSTQHGLPLDQVYEMELDRFRRDGRRLMECGLFGHSRQTTAGEGWNPSELADVAPAENRRVAWTLRWNALIHLMRLAFYFARSQGVTDFVIGVHPRHAKFYVRLFGFQEHGPVRTYCTVRNRPVVLLHGDVEQGLKLNPLPPALGFFVAYPVDADLFDERFDLGQLRRTEAWPVIESYLRDRYPERVKVA